MAIVRFTRAAASSASLASVAIAAIAAIAFGSGCVATIREVRIPGPDHPTVESRSELAHESREGASVVAASIDGTEIDVGLARVVECRDTVTLRSTVHEVQIVRSFADGAQERNVALSLLLAAGLGIVAYAANQPVCSPGRSGCSLGAATGAEYALVGASAIPLGLIGYNALRARHAVVVEPGLPRIESGAWAPCAMRPMAGEAVEVAVGIGLRTAITGPDGHAVVDASELLARRDVGVRRATVRHSGSAEVEIDLPPAPASRP